MLNRSLLRSRVFHRLYGLQVVFDGTLLSFFDKIREDMEWNSESGEKLPAEEQKKLYKAEKQKFLELIKLDSSGSKKKDRTISDELISDYRNQIKQEAQRARQSLLDSAENVKEAYLSSLDFIGEFCSYWKVLENEKEKNLPKGLPQSETYRMIEENLFMAFFVENKPFTNKNNRIDWTKEEDCIRMVFLDAVKNDEDFKRFLLEGPKGKSGQVDILLHLVSERIFSHQGFNSLFEERFISWFQDKKIVRNMVRKFIKELDPKKKSFSHTPLSSNWQEDKEFFLDLWDHSIEDWNENEHFLSEQAKNWDPERIALTDKTLIIMGMSEMVHFPSIPVKVTINEYIELSKKYSTPNSKTFVNGVLDKVSSKWMKSGKVKKSGRGLIDNK